MLSAEHPMMVAFGASLASFPASTSDIVDASGQLKNTITSDTGCATREAAVSNASVTAATIESDWQTDEAAVGIGFNDK